MKKRFIVVHGPTGVGKSDVITSLGNSLPIEIVNCDVGQFYEPFAIGTAKPDWKNEPVPHHLFDLIKEPKDCTVTEYRSLIIKTIDEIWARGNIPVLVGGSGFYGKSLFFPPQGEASSSQAKPGNWEDLEKRDPKRALQIDKNDRYRIERALQILESGNGKPSDFKPKFSPPDGDCLVVFLNRQTEDLYQRINQRTAQMLQEGWLDEVQNIIGTEWETFLERKKLIGYTNILHYLKKIDNHEEARENLEQVIAQKTRHYAKRQRTFWRMFKKLLEPHFKGTRSQIVEVDLTEDKKGLQLNSNLKEFLS